MMKGVWCYRSKQEIDGNKSREICKICKGEFLRKKILELC